MKLKRLILSLSLSVIATTHSWGVPVLPRFSDDSNEYWYYILFSAGETVLSDQGAPMPVITRIPDSSKENQLWKFIGNQDDFIIINKSGSHVMFNNYIRTSNDETQVGHFRLVASTHSSMQDSWEIEYPAKGDEWNRWNQWGNTGSGVNIGLYTPGEANNGVTFLAQEDLPNTPKLTNIKEFSSKPITGYTLEKRHTIWFGKPATAETVSDTWMEYGLPIGNGEFGAMIFGGVAQDRVQFNDKSLWTGDSKTRGCYQNFGDLYIEDISGVFGYTDETALTNYVRGLDMETGTAYVSYTNPEETIEYSREYIASNPDKVVAIHLTASEPGKISVRLRLFNGIKLGILSPTYKDGEISFGGFLSLIDFDAKVKPVVKGGSVITNDDNIEIVGADEVTIYLAGATNFDQHSPTYISDKNAMYAMVENRISSAVAKGWEAIYTDHTTDFSGYFNRVNFEIEAAVNDRSSRDMVSSYNGRRVDRTAGCNLMLEELYYAFGRYLLISCSRGMDTPANLQGLWNHSNSPSWQCDIHSNINVQMNYWLAESTNLSEMHMPYLNYIYSMAMEHQEWQEYARRSGQTEGWTCFTQNNIFGHSDYAENYVIANAWYTTHLWQHYVYTLDREFLKTKAMPVMLSCVKFWMQRLVKDSDGTWVAPKEWSPEHGPGEEDATAHAQQILNELFRITLLAIETLGDDANVEESFVTELKDKYDNLDKGLATETYTGAWGTPSNNVSTGDLLLREWKTSDYTAGEKEHRHQSHLMAMYPFGEITPESEWFTPAINSLSLRGDVSTGWSLAWRIALWARALDAKHAHTIIERALRHASSYSQSSGAGGIYYNLLDSHAPFQIDGNFGYTAGVTEMLMQSYNGKIRLLPALPEYWVSGKLTGVKGEGNFEISQNWKDLKLTEATIISHGGKECTVNYPGIAEAGITDNTGRKVEFKKIDDDNISFATEKGGIYTITPKEFSSVREIETPGMQIFISGNTAYVTNPDVMLTAYDITGGTLLISEDSRLDISSLENGVFIIKANKDGISTVKKVIK